MFTQGNDPEFLAFLAEQPHRKCVVAEASPEFAHECRGRMDPAHVVGRAHTGQDRGNAVPCCRFHHRRQNAIGWSLRRWREHYKVDLEQWAQVWRRRYEKRLKEAF